MKVLEMKKLGANGGNATQGTDPQIQEVKQQQQKQGGDGM